MDKLPKVTSEGSLRAFLIIELLRSTGEKEFPAQLMATFLYIAAHNGCSQQDVLKATHIAASSVSRCITWLGPRHRLEHRSGLKLVRRERDPNDWKAYRLFLTPKGEIFKQLLESYISGSLPSDLTTAKEALTNVQDDEDLG